MKSSLTFGLYGTLATATLTLLLYFAGFHDSVEKFGPAQWIGGVAGFVALVACQALAMRQRRSLAPADAEWGYGSAFGSGVLTALVMTAASSLFTYIYFAFINPNMTELIFQMQVAKMEERGMSASQLANAEPMMRKMIGPVISTIFQAVFGFVFSVLIALVVAIFFRKPRPEAAPSV